MASERRLIDVNDFMAKLKERHEYIMQDPEVSKRIKWCEAVHYGATTAIIEKMPTIEATPVVHGRWKDRFNGKINTSTPVYECSVCGKPALYKHCFELDLRCTMHQVRYLSPYCPNCGAKMRGSEE